MLNMMKRVSEPSVSYADKLMFMTSLGLNHGIGSDNIAPIADNICTLIASDSTRYIGLQALEIALRENSDIYCKARWNIILYETLKDSGANILKEQACKILCMTMPFMANDITGSSNDLQGFFKDLFPFLLEKIDENVEWADGATKCVHTCLKTFPQALVRYQDQLLGIILNQISSSVSSKLFEVIADCFSELPNCKRDNDPNSFQDRWKNQYMKTLKTIQVLMSSFNIPNDGSDEIREVQSEEYIFMEEDDDDNMFTAYMKQVRRFINLCKCLAKMLSTHSKITVSYPARLTLECLLPLYTLPEKIKITRPEHELFFSYVAQMQIAALAVVESVILSCNTVHNTLLLRSLIVCALRSSKSVISTEVVSHLRFAVWKLLGIWLTSQGIQVSSEIVQRSEIIDELLKDISVELKETSQASSSVASHHKSKKNVSSSVGNKSFYKKKNQQLVCKEALKSLESLMITGAPYMSKEKNQEISTKIMQICHKLRFSDSSFPSPYDDERCRKRLYSALLALVVTSKPSDVQSLQGAVLIYRNASKDPSFKVRNIVNKSVAVCRLSLHPKRPPPAVCSDEKQRQSNISNQMFKYSEWASEDYIPNIQIETVSEAPENIEAKIEDHFHNEIEIQSEEYMEVEQHYPEQTVESQCNGEEIIRSRSSSQCQDEVESEDEDEEEDEERSYGDEEMNQEVQQENVYPVNSRKLQSLNPVHISPIQNADEPEYQELRPTEKTESNVVAADSDNKNMQLNGKPCTVPDEEVPSSSTQPTIANENGIYNLDEDDLEDEEDDEDEEEENASFPAEKKVEYYDPPLKKQKMDIAEVKEDVQNEEREQNSRSPTLAEMKADFCCTEVEDVKS